MQQKINYKKYYVVKRGYKILMLKHTEYTAFKHQKIYIYIYIYIFKIYVTTYCKPACTLLLINDNKHVIKYLLNHLNKIKLMIHCQLKLYLQ